MRDDFPTADPARERDAREMFPRHMTPEEYAARHAHQWYCFSFDDYRYADTELDRWVQRLGDILFQRDGAPTLTQLREQYLSEEERRAIENEIAHSPFTESGEALADLRASPDPSLSLVD